MALCYSLIDLKTPAARRPDRNSFAPEKWERAGSASLRVFVSPKSKRGGHCCPPRLERA